MQRVWIKLWICLIYSENIKSVGQNVEFILTLNLLILQGRAPIEHWLLTLNGKKCFMNYNGSNTEMVKFSKVQMQEWDVVCD